MSQKEEKILKSETEYDFNLALVILDFFPCVFFGLSMCIIGKWFGSFAFIVGAVICTLAGCCKVVWKLLILLKKKDIPFLSRQMRVAMPVGMLLLAGSIVYQYYDGLAIGPVFGFILQSPSRWLIYIGLFLMGLMLVWAFVLDSKKVRNHWIEEITNTCAQACILIGVMILAYAGDYYHYVEIPEAQTILSQYNIEIQDYDGYTAFWCKDATTGLIFYPGGKVEAKAYDPFLEVLASKGIASILIKMPDNLAILDFDAAQELDYREHLPQIQQWYIGGHSLGGTAAAMYMSGLGDEALELYEGLILMGAYSTKDLSKSGLRTMTIFGTQDYVMNADNYEKYYSNLAADNEERIIDGGCHSYFGSYGHQEGDGTPTISAFEQWEICAEEIADFIER